MFGAGADRDCGKVILLITTNRRVERFVPHIRRSLGLTWPSRPPYFFVTDGSEKAPDTLNCDHEDFAPLLLQGIERARDRFPDATHIFHMLEDHAPLRAVEPDAVDGFIGTALRRDLAAMSFVTYRWPWHEVDPHLHDDALVRTWPQINVKGFDGRDFAVVPKDFFRYYQVQPTLWRADYLARVLRTSISRGVVDPWGFEAIRIEDCEQHFVADYPWPTVHHGFLAQGAVNVESIRYIDGTLLTDFRKFLMKEFSGSDYAAAYYARSARMFAERVVDRISRRVGKVI